MTRPKPHIGLSWIVRAALIAIAGPAIVILAALLYRSTLFYPINYNEGWNAYFTQRVIDGLALYPPPQATIVNNYPPASFYIVAGISKLTGQIWIAGRVVAWISFFGCAALIGAILASLRCNRIGAAFGTALFCGLMSTRYDLYVGMFDPQMTAHLLMLGGLFTLMRREAMTNRGIMLAAAMMAIGGFVKHNPVALPLTVTIWLACFHRQKLVAWFAAGGAFTALGLAICGLACGSDFFTGITAPRRYSWSNAYRKIVNWVLPIQLPVLAALIVPFANRRDDKGAFIAIYAACSVVIGVVGAAGDYTNFNVIFDLIIAASLGVGYVVGRSDVVEMPIIAWIATACAASFILSTAQVATANTSRWGSWIAEQHRRVGQAQRVVDFIGARPGPALCGDLLFCQWAGKKFEFDPLNFEEGVLQGRRDQDVLLTAIRNHYFDVIQISANNDHFLPETLDAIDRYYQRSPDLPALFVPKPLAR